MILIRHEDVWPDEGSEMPVTLVPKLVGNEAVLCVESLSRELSSGAGVAMQQAQHGARVWIVGDR